MIELPILGQPLAGDRAAFSHNHADGPRNWRRFDVDSRQYVYVAAGSQVYAIDGAAFDAAALSGDPLAALEIPQFDVSPRDPTRSAPVRALSLAIAQKCNLGCTYCYAEGGDFGAAPKAMSTDTARSAVDLLFAAAHTSQRVNLSFLGGEPLLARDVLRETTQYAAELGRRRQVAVGFAITTNATLLNAEDADFFERFGFAVTISLDGVGAAHDRQRPFKGGGGSYQRILANVRPLLGRALQVFARATVTSESMDLRAALEGLLSEGFQSVGFAPMLAAPTGRGELDSDHLREMLARMIECGREFERRVLAGETYGFANLIDALGEIHKGSHRRYPCGAGNGYFGVSAEGELAACHRFVGDPAGAMGTLTSGVDPARQEDWLRNRFVDHQEPCRSCWARYLCGGGCHHEVLRRGRPACDYIRGWLHFALQSYARLLAARPDYFRGSARADGR